MKKVKVLILLISLLATTVHAQQLLTLDSCRAMALRNNKQMDVARMKQGVAQDLRRAARTKYLPHVSAIGTYQWTSEELSLLSNAQKNDLGNIGTNMVAGLQGATSGLQQQLGQVSTLLGQLGLPMEMLQQMAGQLQQQMGQTLTGTASQLNQEGQKIVDAFHTDTRNIFAGSVVVTQPVFMGGAITALNRLADLNEELADNSMEARRQAVLYTTDQAYWQVVSLRHKQQLAESFVQLVRKLDSDVQKMIAEGVATRSDGLSVSVKVNEAEMALQKVSDGLVLSRMLLCQRIGLPLDTDIVLADEQTGGDKGSVDILAAKPQGMLTAGFAEGGTLRPELRMLETSVNMSRQATNLLRAANLPQIALMGGYAISNPNVLNGFQKKFGGFWNVGVLIRIPIWNWGDNMYKVRASKGVTAIASLELEETRELIELQVSQSSFRVTEADKRMALARTSIERAEENLRTAQIGFSEGVITPTTVMEAQTAWLQAQSQLIDAEIELRLSQVDLQKALGVLSE